MSKTILADVSGFTPIIDSMAREHGLIYAAVFGRMWRFCQMEDGVCKASLDTIAAGLHVDKATISRYAERLVADGYLRDLTPSLRNSPHVYADTGKASIRVGIGATVAGCNAGVEDDNATVAQCNATVAESRVKIDPKKDPKKDSEEGISLPDFDRAITLLNERHPAVIQEAQPVLLEYNEKPFRLRVRVQTLAPGFMVLLSDALREANPRRNYRVEFETNGTGHQAEHKPAPRQTAPDVKQVEDAAQISDEDRALWDRIKEEITTNGEKPGTQKWAMARANIRDVIAPARLLSVNGSWTVEVPILQAWLSCGMGFTVKRIYKRETGREANFEFVEVTP